MSYDCTQPIGVRPGIRIRPFHVDDASYLFPRFVAEREDTDLFWIGSIDRAESIAYVVAEIERVYGLLQEQKRLGGAIEVEGRAVGSCRLAHVELGVTGDLGYWIFDEYRGQGIVTDCCKALIDVAFKHLNLKEVTIGASAANKRSCAMAERLGFEHIETFVEGMERAGQVTDAFKYRFTRDAWENPSS